MGTPLKSQVSKWGNALQANKFQRTAGALQSPALHDFLNMQWDAPLLHHRLHVCRRNLIGRGLV
jgi:hypothetical protein